MSRCRICDQDAPAGANQCPNCGAPIEVPQAIPPDAEDAELLQLLQAGRKIEAVKRYKERTGTSLVEAKQAVEELAARHGVTPAGGGCAGLLLVVALAACRVATLVAGHG